MNDANPSGPDSETRHQHVPVDLNAAWQSLLGEMSELHARLEYLRLMLKIGVRA